MSEEGVEVYLFIYDLSSGMARMMSQTIIGRQIDGIWHTGVVVYDREYFYGSQGVSRAEPGNVIGEPLEKLKLGTTHVPQDIFEEYLNGLHETEFRGEDYHLLKHNCNNFSDAISHFLVGSGIPAHIVSLPEDILNTPGGQLFRPLIERITSQAAIRANTIDFFRRRDQDTEFHQLNQDIETARNCNNNRGNEKDPKNENDSDENDFSNSA